MSLPSRDEAPSESSIASALSARSNFAAAGKSEDETIVLASHFVLERGKKQIIQKWVEAFTGWRFDVPVRQRRGKAPPDASDR